MQYNLLFTEKTACIILLHVHPLLGNGLVNKFLETFLVNSPLLGYATILITEVFSMWSALCLVLSNRTVNTSAIIDVFYGVRAKSL
jgi:hypothetical protein